MCVKKILKAIFSKKMTDNDQSLNMERAVEKIISAKKTVNDKSICMAKLCTALEHVGKLINRKYFKELISEDEIVIVYNEMIKDVVANHEKKSEIFIVIFFNFLENASPFTIPAFFVHHSEGISKAAIKNIVSFFNKEEIDSKQHWERFGFDVFIYTKPKCRSLFELCILSAINNIPDHFLEFTKDLPKTISLSIAYFICVYISKLSKLDISNHY